MEYVGVVSDHKKVGLINIDLSSSLTAARQIIDRNFTNEELHINDGRWEFVREVRGVCWPIGKRQEDSITVDEFFPNPLKLRPIIEGLRDTSDHHAAPTRGTATVKRDDGSPIQVPEKASESLKWLKVHCGEDEETLRLVELLRREEATGQGEKRAGGGKSLSDEGQAKQRKSDQTAAAPVTSPCAPASGGGCDDHLKKKSDKAAVSSAGVKKSNQKRKAPPTLSTKVKRGRGKLGYHGSPVAVDSD
mmetsp:Transcript_15745/g.26117  ORF Transcript_15745/g.26117 Transcript_15745/m.26117 type:complete len:247 (+) Transcript_15745:58-798(+)